ncbi:MAG TPA: 50S ribosomal protein L3 [Clostridia bacterium]|nr:50S ribosomal protein L3 [Clostridia bacterium]
MKKAILGKKIGMTQVFDADGTVVPVTVIQAGPCTVIQKKTVNKDGYSSIKVGYEPIKEKNVTKPVAGQFKKADAAPMRYIRELRLEDADSYEVGQEIKCDIFQEGDIIDVIGTSRGRGFTGVILRWNQRRGPMSHGSGYHRGVGSMGAHSDPSRVLKNKKMPGQYGNERVTVQNLKVVKVDTERNVLLVKGAVPGIRGSFVFIRDAVKK